MSYGLLQIIANVSLGHVPTGPAAVLPQWPSPDPGVVRAQATLYASLAASLLAAFVAMLGKQWLNSYSQMEKRGSVIDRSRYRQRKMDGMDTWHFYFVMECLPLMLQGSLFLLGHALSEYLFPINKVIGSVTISFTVCGALFYSFIVPAATFSYNCPFQTPLSRILRLLFRLDNEHKKYPERTGKRLRRISSHKKNRAFDGNGLGDHIELRMADIPDQLPLLFEKETEWGGYVLDSNCIARMFQMSIDADVSMAIMKFIPEVVWHAGIQTTPLERLYDMTLECFDHSSGRPVVIPKLRDKAYPSAKALLHLAIQRKCIGNDSDKAVFESISNWHPTMGSEHYKEDSDLESTLGIVDRVFGISVSEPMRWNKFSFTVPHHAWMGHILLYRAWDAITVGQPLPDDTKEFVLHSLQSESPPPAPIVADCLFIVGLVLGIQLRIDDLLVVDKR